MENAIKIPTTFAWGVGQKGIVGYRYLKWLEITFVWTRNATRHTLTRLTYRDGKYLGSCLEARCARWLRVLTLMFAMNSGELFAHPRGTEQTWQWDKYQHWCDILCQPLRERWMKLKWQPSQVSDGYSNRNRLCYGHHSVLAEIKMSKIIPTVLVFHYVAKGSVVYLPEAVKTDTVSTEPSGEYSM